MPTKKAKRSPLEFLTVDVMVLSDHNATVASTTLLTDEGHSLGDATGSSKRIQGDVFDQDTATLLAVGRALEKLGRKLRAEGNKRVVDASNPHTVTKDANPNEIVEEALAFKGLDDFFGWLNGLPPYNV
jgi:hypothetical protein